MTVTATFKPEYVQGIKGRHRRDTGYKGGSIALAIDGENTKTVVDLRLYESASGSTVWACLWVRDEHGHSGSGTATGGGFDINSSAVQAAIEAAGIKVVAFSLPAPPRHSIEDMGREAIRAAVQGIAETASPETAIHVIDIHP